MILKIGMLASYCAILVAIGWFARHCAGNTPAEYFLGGRRLGTLVLLSTLAATNFSAFTVFGCSGAGYRDGLAYLPLMAFGTGFMALSFWLIGRRVWQLGREHGLITPAELIGKLYANRWLTLLFAVVMILWTVPYLALQPLAGGMVLNNLFGLPHLQGAVIVSLVIVLYTWRGGLKAVAWTDVFQGLLLLGLLLAALVVVANGLGGLTTALAQVQQLSPELLNRPGGQGTYNHLAWFSILLLWFYCDPMFPQLFQRFYSARSEQALGRSMVIYPLVTTLVFFPPILMGVLGTLRFPNLTGKEADNILPLLMTQFGGEVMGTLVMIAALAALMSTMDSQLLTASSIFTRDILPSLGWRSVNSVWGGRVCIAMLALGGLFIAVNPPASILAIGLTAFTGLAGLFPTVLFGLYLRNPYPAAGIVSIISSQMLLFASQAGWIPLTGFTRILAVMLVSTFSYLAVQYLFRGWFVCIPIRRSSLGISLVLFIVFLLANDFWNWGRSTPVWFGLPYWIWLSVGLSAVQIAVSALLLRSDKTTELSA
jgi:SSS family solute:Na+ symporter